VEKGVEKGVEKRGERERATDFSIFPFLYRTEKEQKTPLFSPFFHPFFHP